MEPNKSGSAARVRSFSGCALFVTLWGKAVAAAPSVTPSPPSTKTRKELF